MIFPRGLIILLITLLFCVEAARPEIDGNEEEHHKNSHSALSVEGEQLQRGKAVMPSIPDIKIHVGIKVSTFAGVISHNDSMKGESSKKEHEDPGLKCHVIYMTADNNLHRSMEGDLEELANNVGALSSPHYYPLLYVDRKNDTCKCVEHWDGEYLRDELGWGEFLTDDDMENCRNQSGCSNAKCMGDQGLWCPVQNPGCVGEIPYSSTAHCDWNSEELRPPENALLGSCEDAEETGRHFEDDSPASCADLAHLCGDAFDVRAACPETCGDCLAIRGILAQNGNESASFYGGARYIEKDFKSDRLRVAKELGTQNSDDPNTIKTFLSWAFQRCRERSPNGAEILLTFSSHGGGWAGFGGDESLPPPGGPSSLGQGMVAAGQKHSQKNQKQERSKKQQHKGAMTASVTGEREGHQQRQHKRHKHRSGSNKMQSQEMVQIISNGDLRQAISKAMAEQSPPIEQLSLLSFDACLMQSYDACREFEGIAEWYMGSEATEPGHGWDYSSIEPWRSVKGMAVQFIKDFSRGTQGELEHQWPKTLAVFRSSDFAPVRVAVDDLATALMESACKEDYANVVDFVRQAFIASEKVHGILLTERESKPDLGDLLLNMETSCQNPAPGSACNANISTAVANAKKKYDIMLRGGHFEAGPGTSDALTGMAIFMPISPDPYEDQSDLLSELEEDYFSKKHQPWRMFVRCLLQASNSACCPRQEVS